MMIMMMTMKAVSLQHSLGACLALWKMLVLLSADHNDAGDNDAISLNLLTLSPIQAVSLQPSSGACFSKEAGPREGLEGDWEGEDLKVQMR